jgi:hypothetical protein
MVIVLFSFSNIFFRSQRFDECTRLLSQIFNRDDFWPGDFLVEFIAPLALGGHQIDRFNFYCTLVLTFLTLVFERRLFLFFNREEFRPIWVFIVCVSILLFGVFGSGERFIYMQF